MYDSLDVVVTGIGLYSCLGSLGQTWESLINLRSGIKLHQPFPEFPPYPLGLIAAKPSDLNHLTQLVLTEALQDANLKPPLSDCGVVIGSSRSCQASWEFFASQKYQPNNNYLSNWLDTLPHQPAILTARYIKTSAPVLAPMAACATGIWAIARGYELIRQGSCQRVIVGAIETPITKLTLAGFQKIGALATTGCYPFSSHREGLVLGEGGAMLVLESAELAMSRGASIYGAILGLGLSCDAVHISAPEVSGKTAIRAIKRCLEQAGLNPQDIDYIHAHGTGTKLNDAREAQIIHQLFADNVPVSSTKGATGHTLGASGAMASALSFMALKNQQLPPNIGLTIPEFPLDIVATSRFCKIEKILCFSFGFGGQNAIVVLGFPLVIFC
jgi:3-oxoacyl-[acyl-carrier-protein] synthase II